MNKDFLTMKTNVGNNVQDTDSTFLGYVGTWLNNRYREVKRRLKHVLTQTAFTNYTFSVTSGTEDYVMPDDMRELISVVDKTNLIQLAETTIQRWVDKHAVDSDTAGTVEEYILLDSPVKTQPASAGAVTIVSSSASDTVPSIQIRGLDSNGREIAESVTITGTTNATSTNSFSKIIGLSKSAVTVGTITVTSGATTLATLSPNMKESRYKLMRLVSIPSSGLTLELTYLQEELPLINDRDYPLIDCAEVIEAGATADAWRYKRQFAKAQSMELVFEKLLANFAFDLESHTNRINFFNPKPYSRNNV